MNIQIHHSGSSGNLYQADELLLEAGVPIKKIKQALDFRLSLIRACLITHEHMDHAKGIRDLIKAGVDCHMSRGTAEALGVSGHRINILRSEYQVNIGKWAVIPFAVPHDAAEPLGFLIANGRDKLLFATDCSYIPFRFNGITHIILGVDHDLDIMKENVREQRIDVRLANRILKNHMSIQTAEEFFRANDMSKVEEIHLVHLSTANADPEQFRARIEAITGRPVSV